ncbi:MAG TPA: TraB/GumN family protein, partial [Allosphingosinicella sp.]
MALGMKSLWAAAATACALAGCAAEPGAGSASGATGAPLPAMWKVADSDTTVYLFGTIHALPKGQTWRSPAFEQALASADELVLEIANAEDAGAAGAAMMKLGLTAGLPPLRERVPEARRAALDDMIKGAGIPAQALDQVETWTASVILLGVSFQRMGLDPALGVEKAISGPFKASGKPVRGLETFDEQFGFFDTLPEEQQRTFLLGVLDSPEEAKKQLDAMIFAWGRGDQAGLAKAFADEQNLSPELREVLLTRRNAKWAEWLDARMDRPGTAFVAVGAGHLAGEGSVQALLKARGYTAKRVQ